MMQYLQLTSARLQLRLEMELQTLYVVATALHIKFLRSG